MTFKLSVTDAVEQTRRQQPVLNAFVTTRLDEALVEAKQGRAGPLAGVPYGLKDLWDTAGIRTTVGSWRYRDRVPSTSAPVFDALHEAGAVLIGKTNLSDMSLPPEATSYVGGPTRNPYALSRTAGGSSGGSACAVASGMVAFDWGSDFGGSIRLPAAFCGIYGLRLSSVTWPVRGTLIDAPGALGSFNGQGPLTTTLPQMRAVLSVLRQRLRTGAERPFTWRGIALWPPDRGQWQSFAADVAAHLRHATANVIDAELPSPTRVRNIAVAMYASHFDDMVATDEMSLGTGLVAALSALLFRGYFGDKRLHPTTARLVLLMAIGRYLLFRSKAKACAEAALFQESMARLWDRGYLVAAPVCCYPPPRIGRTLNNINLVSCAVGGNVSDATALAIPFGQFANGLPRALQLVGPPGSESAVLDAAEKLVASRDRDATLQFPREAGGSTEH